MTRPKRKALRRLAKASDDLRGYIARLKIARDEKAITAEFGTQTNTSKTEFLIDDWTVVLPIDIALDMAKRAQRTVRRQMKAAGGMS
jgi:hypothetical protein